MSAGLLRAQVVPDLRCLLLQKALQLRMFLPDDLLMVWRVSAEPLQCGRLIAVVHQAYKLLQLAFGQALRQHFAHVGLELRGDGSEQTALQVGRKAIQADRIQQYLDQR